FVSIVAGGLLAVDIIYNLKYMPSANRTILTTITLQNVKGSWVWPALGVSYCISKSFQPIIADAPQDFIVMVLIWRNWQAMVQLRQTWFRST
ncbi:hypothetical protein N4308_14340, partial [Staphylococcus aureus]|uniref:hypothetical protein n=1 Tax=Staphylococcus aureus TaxID=1280 RepID=UPI0021B0D63E